jgi:hypothetical protein
MESKYIFFNPVTCFLYKAKDLSVPLVYRPDSFLMAFLGSSENWVNQDETQLFIRLLIKSRCRALSKHRGALEKLTVPHLFKIFSDFYWLRRFIALFTRACHWTRFIAAWIHPRPFSLRSFGTRRFMNVFTRACHRILHWGPWIHCTLSRPISVRCRLMLASIQWDTVAVMHSSLVVRRWSVRASARTPSTLMFLVVFFIPSK